MKRNIRLLARTLLCFVTSTSVVPKSDGAQLPLLPQEVDDFLKKIEPAAAPALVQQAQPAEAPRYSTTAAGFLRSVGAPPGHHFPTVPRLAVNPPHEVAQTFLRDHARLFGISSPAVDFVHVRTKSANKRNHVRMQQTYLGIPLVAAE